jgi:hypothetical protein
MDDALRVIVEMNEAIWGRMQWPLYGTPALLMKTAARFTRAAICEDEALLARKALNASPLKNDRQNRG